jgi:predicted MPP superfamily phosphohydrolase
MSKILAVGDIHTKQWIIDMVESVIDNYDRVVFCGDFADNFNATAADSISTWYRIWDLFLDHPNKVKLVRGNHDYIYTVKTPTLQSGYDHITQTLIDSPEHYPLKEWLSSLPLFLEIDGVTYAHAGIDERWNGKTDVISMWQNYSPIWTRPEWARYKNIKQVVGHTPQKTVTEIMPGIWLIDTFSQFPNGEQYGDGSMLVVTEGQDFKKININANNYNPSGLKNNVS